MHRRLGIIIAFISSFSSISQETSSYREIDSLSYVAFVKNDLSMMKSTQKRADKNEISYYYLSMRSGIVAYNHERYDMAIEAFELAFEMNPNDSVCKEYLYFAYLLGGRVDVAYKFAFNQDVKFKEKVRFEEKNTENIQFSFLSLNTNNIEDNASKKMLQNNNPYADGVYNGNVTGYSIALQNKLGSSLRLINQLSLFRTNSQSVEQFGLNNYNVVRSYQNNQFQYNLTGSYFFKKGIELALGFAYFKTNTDYSYSEFIPTLNRWSTIDVATSYSNNLYDISLTKRFKYIQPKIELSTINLYNQRQNQIEGSVFLFPFGNNKLYSQTAYAFISSTSENLNVFSQKIGFKLTDIVWVDINSRFGDLFNYLNSNGLVVYNSADLVKRDVGLFCNFYFEKLDVSLGYSNQLKQGVFYNYNGLFEEKSSNYNYTSNNFITSIKWKF